MPSVSKSHAQLVGLFVDVSSKSTLRGALPLIGAAVKDATGATGWGPSTS